MSGKFRSTSNRTRKKKPYPLEKKPLVMDAIYLSEDPEVDTYYSQVVKEEQNALESKVNQGETWAVDSYLDRVHMRMGVRFFRKLSPIMQKRFCAEYPLAFIGAASNGSVQMSTAV